MAVLIGLYECQWIDPKEKKKQKCLGTLPNEEMFAFVGLWNEWKDPSTGEYLKTYTILTTEANELMSKIHNSKKRMPIILNDKTWLSSGRIVTKYPSLVATLV
jgi:putative SOS response-associated peptidase YedK